MKQIQEMDELEIKKELEFARLARDILESIPGLCAVDEEGKITYICKRNARAFGFTPEECIGRPVEEISPKSELRNLLRFGPKGEPLENEFSFDAMANTVRRRHVVYRDGKRTPENAEGLVALSVLNIGDNPGSMDELLRALEYLFLRNGDYRDRLTQIFVADQDSGQILGSSPETKLVRGLIRKVAPTAATICILGETGTGKELVANIIHKLSRRADKPFVKINCAAIPKDLLESELFGYEPGAFTGASRNGKPGKFELASGGTLLLDEIGELPTNLQAKLLRVIQEGEVERVGGIKPIPVDVRLLCSTNRDLRKMVAEGKFRADLYYRINTMEIKVPPLRKRMGDIDILVSHFISESNRKNDLSVSGISQEALALLRARDWPGNVRELANAVERACILCGTGELKPYAFSFLSSPNAYPEFLYQNLSGDDFEGQSTLSEKETILNALAACGGKKIAAAKMLGIARSTLYQRMEKYAIK